MRISATFALVIALVGLVAPTQAHSLKEMEDALSMRDKYFQAVDQPAPTFTLLNAAGEAVNLSDLRDKVVILNFIYASCGDVCPLHSVLISQLQSMINDTLMKDRVAFVSITTDPSNDTGQVLSDYGTSHGLDPNNWTFLTSPASEPEDTTRQLAKAYGLVFEQADGMQMHGIVTNVIDKRGQLRGRFHGLNFQPLSLVTFANGLVNDLDRPHPDPKPEGSLWSWFTSLFSAPGQPSNGGGL